MARRNLSYKKTEDREPREVRDVSGAVRRALKVVEQRPGITGQQILMQIGENTFTECGTVTADAEKILNAVKKRCKVIKSGLTGGGGIISDSFYPAGWEPKKRPERREDRGLVIYHVAPQPYEPPKDVRLRAEHREQQVKAYRKTTPKTKRIAVTAKPEPAKLELAEPVQAKRQEILKAIEELQQSGEPISVAAVAEKIGCEETMFHKPAYKREAEIIAKAIVSQFS